MKTFWIDRILAVPSAALITPLPANIFPNRLAPNKIFKKFNYFTISSISSFEIVKVVLRPDPKIFLCIPASATDAVNPKGIKTLLTNG